MAWSTFWLTPGRAWRFSWNFHRQFHQRKQLSAFLSARQALGPGGLARLMEDDDAFGEALSRFLAEHQVATPLPLYDEAGRYLFVAPHKFSCLATALLNSVRRARDNEVFVLMVDGLDAGDALQSLERAVGVARGKHHQVVIVQPWPADVPAPSKKAPAKESAETAWENLSVEDFLLRATQERMLQAFESLQARLVRTGAIVLCAKASDVPDTILRQMQKLRQVPHGGRR